MIIFIFPRKNVCYDTHLHFINTNNAIHLKDEISDVKLNCLHRLRCLFDTILICLIIFYASTFSSVYISFEKQMFK